MRLLAELLLLPVTGPVRGLRFIAEKIQEEMDAAVMDSGQLEGELINLSLRHDLGQISGEQYEAEEAYLLEQLEAARAYQEALAEEYQEAYEWEMDNGLEGQQEAGEEDVSHEAADDSAAQQEET